MLFAVADTVFENRAIAGDVAGCALDDCTDIFWGEDDAGRGFADFGGEFGGGGTVGSGC